MWNSSRKRRILIFSPPFCGHLNILKEFIRKFAARAELQLVITGWTNVRAAAADLSVPVVSLEGAELQETDPALWTLPRAAELLDGSLRIGRAFRPDLVLYDFFSLEGALTARLLGVPCAVSIPAMLGPNDQPEYLRAALAAPGNIEAMAALRDKFGLAICPGDFELISDGIHLPAPLSLVWSYRSVVDPGWQMNRARSRYMFAGNIRGRRKENRRQGDGVIYFSLGTVVLGNLWRQQEDTRARLVSFIAALAARWATPSPRVVFASQGCRILPRYPGSWKVLGEADQIACLSEADLFITHGGSNSFHEALLEKVPMMVIPFFGDQPLVARCAERLGIGRNMVPEQEIGTKANKSFLGEDLASRIVLAAENLTRDSRYRQNFENIDLQSDPLDEVVLGASR